ncbi:MAG: protein kinase [Pseudomonadota bacterium]
MLAGDRVGPFALLEVIGRGGMGEVWRAHDTRLDRDVALKTLPDRVASDAAAIARLEREARLLAALNHPNISAILGLEEHDGRRWLVLELIDGPTLEDRLVDGRLELQEAVAIALQVADALQAAHSRGIVHCDLKPSNIKLLPDGRIKVLDFGIARSLPVPSPTEETQTVTTAPQEIAGTLAYMSPEQARGEPVAPTSDIWAFGILMYRMLAGRLPFAGPTAADTVAQVLQTAPDLSLLRPRVPEALVRLLRRCMEKEPVRRIQNAGDLRVLIEEALVPEQGPEPRRPLLYRRWWAIATLAAAATIAGGLIWHSRADTDVSIAVLPFVNMSADPQQEYFSDGLSEELINRLAHSEKLRVIGRTSSFAFKGRNEDLRKIGEVLGVNHILEGSVRKEGSSLRITAQLIDTRNGSHLWSETYDRELQNVFAIQDEIARAVSDKLRLTIGGEGRKGGTQNIAAYEDYLVGLAKLKGTQFAGVTESVNYLEHAISLDPDFDDAWAALLDAYVALMTVMPQQRAAAQRRVEEITERALDKAPASRAAAVGRGIRAVQARDYATALGIRRTLTASSNGGDAYLSYASLLMVLGRPQDAPKPSGKHGSAIRSTAPTP